MGQSHSLCCPVFIPQIGEVIVPLGLVAVNVSAQRPPAATDNSNLLKSSLLGNKYVNISTICRAYANVHENHFDMDYSYRLCFVFCFKKNTQLTLFDKYLKQTKLDGYLNLTLCRNDIKHEGHYEKIVRF